MKRVIICLSLVGLFAVSTHAQNAQITWQSVQYITGDSDLYSGPGTLFGTASPYLLQNGGAGASLTLNNGDTIYGDDFASFTLPSYMNNYSTSMGSPNTSDANYNSLLEGAVDTGKGQGGNFAFGGLNPGNSYVVEVWTEDTANLGYRQWENLYEVTYGDSGSSGALTYPSDGSHNTYSNGSGPNGNYAIGTFVASASTEQINLETWSNTGGDQQGQVNLLMVWQVPEPSTVALIIGGGLLLLSYRRRA